MCYLTTHSTHFMYGYMASYFVTNTEYTTSRILYVAYEYIYIYIQQNKVNEGHTLHKNKVNE